MRRIIAALLILVVLGGCAPAEPTVSPAPVATATTQPPTSPPAVSVAPTTPAATAAALVPADLDGVLVDAALAHRLPLAVSIDDSRAARPQSGFNAAAVVWQAPADGYESRYLLFIQEQDAGAIGPVRSARIYLAQWSAEIRGALAHYGGDRLTLGWLADDEDGLVANIDGLGRGRPAYHRVKTREAPHNAYTSSTALWQEAARLGAAAAIDPSVHLRPFRDDSPAAQRGTSQQIEIPYNTVKVGYAYDPGANAYLRSLGGKPHIDPMDGRQVMARTVVVLYMSFRTDGSIEPGHSRPVLGFIGSGRAEFFMEGKVVEGTWSKAAVADPTLLLGPDGAELPLLRGQIFIQVVPKSTRISVTD